MTTNQEDLHVINNNQDEPANKEKTKGALSRKFTFKDFLRISGLTILSLSLSAIVIIVGLFLFYWTRTDLVKNAGFWMILVGVVAFMVTVVVGFEKIE